MVVQDEEKAGGVDAGVKKIQKSKVRGMNMIQTVTLAYPHSPSSQQKQNTLSVFAHHQ